MIVVMVMNKKIILSVVFTMLLGIATAKVVYSKTISSDDKKSNNTVYFLQLGVYTNKNSMQLDTKSIENKIVIQENDKYYVYVGISKSKKNLEKVSKLYKNDGYNLYIKEMSVLNNEFLVNLEQFDKLIESAKTNEEINTINMVILSSYEEMVIKS
jgi:opacity protein-like surface antigen